ncbi:MAG: hypothetical protein J0H09_25400, partial [Burkholderiales bacterium]|nr:hypothetical protein [Burkholderiales bacterium]
LKHGRVAFGASPSIAAAMLPAIIQRFMVEHPGVRISMADDLAPPILEKLSSGVLEFGLIPSPSRGSEFDVRPLLSDELVIVAPKSMGIPINRPVRFAELIPYPFVTMSRPSAVWKTMFEAFQQYGHTFKPAFEATSAVTLLGFVESGIGLTVLPAILADQHVLHSSFRVNISDTDFRREISLVTVRGRALSPASAALVALIRAEFRKLPYAISKTRAAKPGR